MTKRFVKGAKYIMLGMMGCMLLGSLLGCSPADWGAHQAKTDKTEKERANALMQSVIDALEAEDAPGVYVLE